MMTPIKIRGRVGVFAGAALSLLATTLAVPTVVAGQQDPDMMEFPLRIIDGRLAVSIDIGHGVQADFVLSTGNAVTVLNQAFVDNHGADGEFRMGDLKLNMDNFATVRHEDLNPGNSTFAGIVGSNTLNEFDMLIDVPNGRLVLKSIGRAVEWDGVPLSEPVGLRVYHGVILSVDVEVDGHPFMAMLDIGTSTLVVSSPAGAALGVESEGSAALGIGSTTFADMPLRVRDLPIFEQFDPEAKGFVLIGAPIAYDCAISISWMHREMRTCVQ